MIFEEFLQNKEVLAALGTIVFIVIYSFAAQKFLFAARERRKRRDTQLHEAISNGLRSRTLVTVEDFVNVYKGVYGLGADDVSYRAGLAKVLREYIVKVVSDSTQKSEDIRRLKDYTSAVLKRIETETPFADLPPAERNLILDIDRFLIANDQDSATSKLQDLAGLIEVRQESLERLQGTNKWSIPLATIGSGTYCNIWHHITTQVSPQ